MRSLGLSGVCSLQVLVTSTVVHQLTVTRNLPSTSTRTSYVTVQGPVQVSWPTLMSPLHPAYMSRPRPCELVFFFK